MTARIDLEGRLRPEDLRGSTATARIDRGCETIDHDFVDTRTAQRNMRVARYATPDDEARYGTSNLDAALGYLEARYGKLPAVKKAKKKGK